jgi:hypothetical protein
MEFPKAYTFWLISLGSEARFLKGASSRQLFKPESALSGAFDSGSGGTIRTSDLQVMRGNPES